MKQRTELFNTIRMGFCGMDLTRNDVKAALKDLPQSQQDLFLSMIVKHNMIKRVKVGVYQFGNTPVHYSVMDAMYKELNDVQKSYQNKSAEKKHQNDVKSEIEKAIDLLLATGEYEIYHIEKIVNVKKTQIQR